MERFEYGFSLAHNISLKFEKESRVIQGKDWKYFSIRGYRG
jgi:hypothetical protein